MRSPAIRLTLGAATVVVLVLVGAACSGDDDTTPDASEAQGEVLPTPTPGTAEEAVPTPPREGVEITRTELNPGDCFNEYRQATENLGLVDITTAVDCGREHYAEVYAAVTHPAPAGEPFPGADEIERWAQDVCYDAFADFVGVEYELSVLAIGTVVPNVENWELGPYRGVHCYVYNPGGSLRGTMRDSRT